jgi:hypothetical protein
MSLKLLGNDYGNLRAFGFFGCGGGGAVLCLVKGKFVSVHITLKNVEVGEYRYSVTYSYCLLW